MNADVRDEWIIQQLSQIPRGFKILDAGAGEQPYKQYCDHLDYVSQDFCEYSGEGDRSGLQTGSWDTSAVQIVSDILSIPLPDNSFDVILCSEVFEHIPYPIAAVKEFYRLLKPGSRLILTAPFACLTHFAPHFYYSGFSRYFYQEVLGKRGFEHIKIFENGNYFDFMIQENTRVVGVAKEYCGIEVPFLYRVLLKVLRRFLTKISKIDKGSSELTSFGLHVLADKPLSENVDSN